MNNYFKLFKVLLLCTSVLISTSVYAIEGDKLFVAKARAYCKEKGFVDAYNAKEVIMRRVITRRVLIQCVTGKVIDLTKREWRIFSSLHTIKFLKEGVKPCQQLK